MRGEYLVYYHCHCVYIGFLRDRALVQSELGRSKEFRCHERDGPFASCRLRCFHAHFWVKNDDRRSEVRKAR